MAQEQDPAVSVCFMVEIDNINLGAFNSCEGLGCEVVMEQREEGGNNGYVWQLPTRIKYSNIKLSRPVTKDTEKVTGWLSGMIAGVPRKTAHISAMTVDGTVVARWSLMDVVPVRWTGPQLNPETVKVATETLEIAHHGFIDAGR
ncbi:MULTISPECIES: phage tail protein [Streptomyces]|uniref:Phage tail protein n=1 Tax=Streptomyces solicathayae TaxID=3081768 RepID=A0ABZ0LPQ7_9ACTN|nr:phage tail protein [Streptomyces sp. HUAS YS2]WOX21468.1 phage tail protein [Streptomyces sp. HUAS YS2]